MNSFENDSTLTSLNIPQSVTQIAAYAFRGTKLTTLDIPAGVTYLGNYFIYDSTVSTIYIHATTPPTIVQNTFNGFSGNIYVPAGSVDAYKSAQYWSSIASKIYPIE